MRRRSLLKIAASLVVVAPASSFLATPRATSSEPKIKRCRSLAATLASPVGGVGVASFEGWLAQQREAAAAAGPDDAPMLVVDAGLDVDTSFTLSGVVWQVLSDVSTCAFGPGDCTVVVHFPGLAHRGSEVMVAFAELFAAARAAPGGLVELARLDVRAPPVPGPALVVRATRPRTAAESALALQRRDASRAASTAEAACVGAVKAFVRRVVVGPTGGPTGGPTATAATAAATAGAQVGGLGACPYTKADDWAATGLEKQGVAPGPVAYRFEPCSDALDAVAACWRAFAEVVNAPEAELSTTLLCLPAVAPAQSASAPPPPTGGASANKQSQWLRQAAEQGNADAQAQMGGAFAHEVRGGGTPGDDGGDLAHGRFAAFADLVSKSLLLCGGDKVLGLVHFHPLYDRNLVYPLSDPAYGHLPPLTWLPAMLTKSGVGTSADAAWLAADPTRLAASNYQRRAPCLVLNVLRASQLDAATGGFSVVSLEVPLKARGAGADADAEDGEHEVAGLHERSGCAPTRTVQASGLRTYSKNALSLARASDSDLRRALAEEMHLAAGL